MNGAKKGHALPFDIDGMVLKVNDLSKRDVLKKYGKALQMGDSV